MTDKIQNYISDLANEVTESINLDYDLSEYPFNSFDFINFHIINKFILNGGKDDLFIGIPEDNYRKNFFQSVLYSVSLIKYLQNYCNFITRKEEFRKGDILFYHNEIYRYLRKENNSDEHQIEKYLEKDAGLNYVYSKKFNAFKLKNEFDYKPRITQRNLSNYRTFFKRKLKSSEIELVTRFSNKTLIISDDQITGINQALPLRYRTKNNTISVHNLPIDVMIEVCNDFSTAQKYILGKEDVFDELIIIRDSKYNNSGNFQAILDAKFNGYYKNLILIGSNKPDTTHKFICWNWTVDEVKVSNKENISRIQKIEIDFPELLDIYNKFKEKIDELNLKYGIDASSIIPFCNYFFKMPLPTANNSEIIFEDKLNQIKAYLKGEDFESIFYNADIYDPEKIESCTNAIIQQFLKVIILFDDYDPKFDQIVEALKGDKQSFIITDKQFAQQLSVSLKTSGIPHNKVISDKKIKENIPNLNDWIKDSRTNKPQKNYYITFLTDFEKYKNLLDLKGQVFVLCYSDIDSMRFDKISAYFDNETEKKITEKDRLKFIKTTFNGSDSFNNITSDPLFIIDDLEKQRIINDDEILDKYRDEVLYNLIFTDLSNFEAKSSKAVFLVIDNEQIKTTIGEVNIGDTIRFYRNETRDDFEKTLEIFDNHNIIQKIEAFSNSWKESLNLLFLHYKSIPILYDELRKRGMTIIEATFNNYFNPNCETHFPRESTLIIIKKLCLELGLTDILFVTNFNEVLKYSAKDKEIRQSFGHILSNDLIDWIDTGEKSENLKKIPDDILDSLKTSVQEKVIKSKRKIEKNETGLQGTLPLNF